MVIKLLRLNMGLCSPVRFRPGLLGLMAKNEKANGNMFDIKFGDVCEFTLCGPNYTYEHSNKHYYGLREHYYGLREYYCSLREYYYSLREYYCSLREYYYEMENTIMGWPTTITDCRSSVTVRKSVWPDARVLLQLAGDCK